MNSAANPDHTHVEVRAGAYADSVALLLLSRRLQQVPGVNSAQVAMATALNLEVLDEMGFRVPATTANDMVVAIRTESADVLPAALAELELCLNQPLPRQAGTGTGAGAGVEPARSTRSALRREPAEVVLISVPGPSAAVEAIDAIRAGVDVMIFSDNVSLATELALKQAAEERDVLVMGPDCGTAVIDGVGLGFANSCRPGPVGIVAASGTGCQQVISLLDHAGVGIAAAYGVGGRDLSAEIGGLSTRRALRRLADNPLVEVIAIISKPPAAEVAAELRRLVPSLGKPVVLALLGPGQPDLTAATDQILAVLGTEPAPPAGPGPATPRPIEPRPVEPRPGRLVGLFVGGTLRDEAALLADAALPWPGSHLMTDFGDDALTRGRAHPMIDPTLRIAELVKVAADPEVAVILLDVVLGHGAEPDPAAALVPVIAGTDKPVVVALIGTSTDPQSYQTQAAALVAAGAEVLSSNATATRRAVSLIAPARTDQEGS